MLEISETNNIAKLVDAFFETNNLNKFNENKRNLNYGSVYQAIVGIGRGRDISIIDKTKQQNVVDFMSRMFKFQEGYSPADGYMTQEDFCRAYSADADMNNIKHRLYFNMGDNRMEFVDLISRKLGFEKGLPFAIKWDKHISRQDNIVMYIEDEHFSSTVKALHEIVEKYPEYATKTELPMSVVNGGWFGYGVEFPSGEDSYNGKVTRCVTTSIMRAVSEFRENIDISSITEFGEFLYEQYAQTRKLDGVKFNEIHEERKIMKPIVVSQSMSLARKFLHKDEGNTGFTVTENGDDAVADGLAVKTIYDYATHQSVDITPNIVMNTLLNMMAQNKCTFDMSPETRDKFMQCVKENLEREIDKAGLPTELPDNLKSLACLTNEGIKQTEEACM